VIRGVENRLAIGENFPGQEERKLTSTFDDIRGRDDEFRLDAIMAGLVGRPPHRDG
jgi:hypothetical protein